MKAQALVSAALFGLVSLCGLAPFSAAQAEERPHLAIELNKVETAGQNCRMTFRATSSYPFNLEDINVEVYILDTRGVVLQSLQFPFGYVLAGKTRFAKFEVKAVPCENIGAMFVNEFKSCKGPSDMAMQCRADLAVSNLTAIKFSDGGP